MKVLLCVPNQLVRLDGMKARPAVGPPLGILSIAAYLRESEWHGSVQIYDARLSAMLRQEGDEQIFGDTDEQIEMHIRTAKPDYRYLEHVYRSD